ncbi:hypothetical protein [Actinokineospora sp. HUAS TT18]|uniref:hypothetical protein n=1 Tax=Actinokineospora sp. HUAS TT18 TaxID=3447451 RepID=UPI003F51B6BE
MSENELAVGVGTLSIHYRDGEPVIIVSGGGVVPETITVTDTAGAPVAVYAAGPVATARIVGGEESPAGSYPFVIDVK